MDNNDRYQDPPRARACTCSTCGKTYRPELYGDDNYKEIMERDSVCFHCAYWSDVMQHLPEQYEVIGGKMYEIRPTAKRPMSLLRGGQGKFRYIRRNDGELIMSNNVCYMGDIPPHLTERFPDTARFIGMRIFQKLKANPNVCNLKGCWDRYDCLRYDLSSEDGGAFNIIPESHIPGSEGCPSFINIHELTS